MTPPSRPRLALIAAVARNGAIGRDNALLWHLPEDLRHFKRTTLGCPVVMGRRTWESIGRPLPGRRNVVVTGDAQWQAAGAETALSLDAALTRLGDVAKVFVIGGAQLYAQALPRADELVLTEVEADPAADTFFPAWSRGDFVAEAEDWQQSAAGPRFRFVTYTRKPPR